MTHAACSPRLACRFGLAQNGHINDDLRAVEVFSLYRKAIMRQRVSPFRELDDRRKVFDRTDDTRHLDSEFLSPNAPVEAGANDNACSMVALGCLGAANGAVGEIVIG